MNTEITIGNLLTAGAMAVTLLLAWAKLKSTADENTRRINELESKSRSNESAIADIHSEVTGMSRDILWIRDNLKRRDSDRKDSGED